MVERREKLRKEKGIKGCWRTAMTLIVSMMDRIALQRMNTVIVENRWMHNYVTNLMPSNHVHFVPPGVDISLFKPLEQQHRHEHYILSVGRFSDPRKNIKSLFNAYSRLHQLMPNAPKLLLAGHTGPSKDDWDLVDVLGIRGYVEFKENVSPRHLAQLYRRAKLFVLSSDEEGLGLVILEAMSSGVPVVSTDCGGPSTLILDGITGYLVSIGDSQTLAQRMFTILSHRELRREMGRRARRRVEEHFSYEVSGKLFLNIYDQLLTEFWGTL
jgi:glycosyltransferase involved in cell wall biosynthesis